MTQMMSALITSVCYVRLAVPEPAVAARFAGDVFGLQAVSAADGEFAFRSDNRFRTVSFSHGDPGGASIGVEVWSEAALEEIEQALRRQEFDVSQASPEACRARHVQAALLARDGSGNAIDLVLRPAQSGRRYFPSRDAGITEFHGIGLRSTKPDRDRLFWTTLGARVSDWVGDIVYLQIDDHHHRVALYPSDRAGLLYAAFAVESLDNIMQNSYFMQESQVRIVQGPGREPASEQMFLHVQGPADIIFSYVSGMARPGMPKRPPRQFPLTLESLCSWGSESKDVAELRAT